MTNMEMRRGDLKPDLIIDLTDRTGLVSLSLASAVNVLVSRDGVLAFKRAATSFEDGVVTLLWAAGDTSTPGTLTAEVEIIWPGNKPQSVRADNQVKILPDLG